MFEDHSGRGGRNRSLDDYLDISPVDEKLPQVVLSASKTNPLPSTCERCGTKTKRAGKRIRKKTGDAINRAICTNSRCGASYNEKQDSIKLVGTALDELINGHSYRHIKKSLEKRHSCKYAASTIKNWVTKYLPLVKILTDDIACSLQFGDTWDVDETHLRISNGSCWVTAVLDVKSRFIITYITTRKRPNHKELQYLFEQARVIANTPKIITTDLYLAYPKAIKKVFGDKVEHRGIRSKTKIRSSSSNHNNYIEKVWDILKRDALRNSSELQFEGIKNLINYAVIHYNYIRKHSNFDSTPAVAAKYVKSFKDFENILNYALMHEKSFLWRLDKYIEMITVKTPNHCKEIIISPKKHVDQPTTKSINRILEDCGFEIEKRNGCKVWVRKTPLLHLMATSRTLMRDIPERSFEICKICNHVTGSWQEVLKHNGFRRMDNIIRTQPTCRRCRHQSSHKDDGMHGLYSIMLIEKLARSGQTILTGLNEKPKTKNVKTYVTKNMFEDKKYVQLSLFSEEPQIPVKK